MRNLIISNYVVVENKDEVLRNNFLFYRELFEKAKIGAAFLFLDSSLMLWDALEKVARTVEDEQGMIFHDVDNDGERADHEDLNMTTSWKWDVIRPGFRNSIIFWKRKHDRT